MGNIERTLAIIKPDALDNFHDIVKMILDLGLVVDYCELRMLDDNIIREHYAHVLEQDFFPRLSEFMKSGPVAVMVFKGEDAVNKGFINEIGGISSAFAKLSELMAQKAEENS